MIGKWIISKNNVLAVPEVPVGSPDASVSPTFILFNAANHPTDVGGTGTANISLINSGDGELIVNDISYSGDSHFSISTACGMSVDAESNCLTTVTFAPTDMTTVTGTVTIDTNDGIFNVGIQGTGRQALGSLSGNGAWGDVLKNTFSARTFTFTNTGNKTLTGVYPVVTGTGFSIGSSTASQASPTTVASGSTFSFTVRFTPPDIGSYTGTVSVNSSAVNSPSQISLSGSGVDTSFILNFNNGNGSTTITDEGNMGGSWSSVGGAAQSTAQTHEGTSSLFLSGSSQALVGPAINLTSNFIVDVWFYPTAQVATGQVSAIVGQWRQSTGQGGWNITQRPNGVIGFSWGATSESTPLIVSATNRITINAWNRVIVSRSGSTVTMNVNGNIQTASASGSRTLTVPVSVGSYYTSTNVLGAGAYFKGYIDQLTISGGTV